MIEEVRYNNKILSPQERVEFCKMADATIKDFSDSIEGMHQCMEEVRSSPDSDFNKISRIFIEVGRFIGFSFCDCVVLTKSFIMASNLYEKSFFRGKLQVRLNESFKKLYGFAEKNRKDSYSVKLGEIMSMFPGFQAEYIDIMSDLGRIATRDSWWKETRNIEVHIDADQLYASRHEPINESKVVMEAHQLINLFTRFNRLMARMNRAYIDFMMRRLKVSEQQLPNC